MSYKSNVYTYFIAIQTFLQILRIFKIVLHDFKKKQYATKCAPNLTGVQCRN